MNNEAMDKQDDLLISYLLREAPAEEVRQVEDWLKTDEAVRKRLEEFRLLWMTSEKLLPQQDDDASEALARFRGKASERNAIPARISPVKHAIRWSAVAASFLLVAAAFWYFTAGRTTGQRLSTAAGTQTASLPDGSVVTLNHRSDLEYPSAFNGQQRSVKLVRGEAFFNVAHDRAKPFVITAGNTLIRVVGTSFNVKNKNGIVEVIVESGIVEVSSGSQVVKLKPGEKILVSADSRKLAKRPNTDQLYTYYRSKVFEADSTPLWRVVEVLNEAYDSHIVIENKELRNLPLNTTFKDESLDKILDVISRTFKISIERKHGTILLK